MKEMKIHPMKTTHSRRFVLPCLLAMLAVTACTAALETPGITPVNDTPTEQITLPPDETPSEPEDDLIETETSLPRSTLAIQTPVPGTVPDGSRPTGAAASLPANLPPIQAAAIRSAISDLAERLNTDVSEISFIRIFADEFPASQLGCSSAKQAPDPMQALVSGQTILLEHSGETYIYHARASEVFYCGSE